MINARLSAKHLVDFTFQSKMNYLESKQKRHFYTYTLHFLDKKKRKQNLSIKTPDLKIL